MQALFPLQIQARWVEDEHDTLVFLCIIDGTRAAPFPVELEDHDKRPETNWAQTRTLTWSWWNNSECDENFSGADKRASS